MEGGVFKENTLGILYVKKIKYLQSSKKSTGALRSLYARVCVCVFILLRNFKHTARFIDLKLILKIYVIFWIAYIPYCD